MKRTEMLFFDQTPGSSLRGLSCRFATAARDVEEHFLQSLAPVADKQLRRRCVVFDPALPDRAMMPGPFFFAGCPAK